MPASSANSNFLLIDLPMNSWSDGEPGTFLQMTRYPECSRCNLRATS